jgi:hypothetical protein
MERGTAATGTSPYGLTDEEAEQKARQRAEKRLRERLANEVDPVPCPNCGHYQREMFPMMARREFRWYRRMGLTFLILTPVALLGAAFCSVNEARASSYTTVMMVFLVLAAVFAAIGIRSFFQYYRRMRSYDPNTESHTIRLAIARERALTATQYEELTKQADTEAAAAKEQPEQPPKPWAPNREQSIWSPDYRP